MWIVNIILTSTNVTCVGISTNTFTPEIFIFGLVNDAVVAVLLHFRCYGRKGDMVATVLFVLGHNPKW
jgi:hypothetical protein